MKKTVFTLFIAFIGGLLGAYSYSAFMVANPEKEVASTVVNHNNTAAEFAKSVGSIDSDYVNGTKRSSMYTGVDFADASAKSTNSVVFIKTISGTEYGRGTWLDWFFEGGRGGQRVGSGSGVIFSNDGYIITNNHVIDDAEIIEIIHGKLAYNAEVVGRDPSTDLAVLKVDANNMPAIALGNSRNLAVGEWVLAVGNPFNLTSTVTAGIVSAKGRDINILKGRFPLESFIQTDAAINPGNSGGALVNAKGELVGINTAILSRTGSYAGYGFAVPVDIVKKVANDLIAYGETQKAFFGAEVIDLTPELAETIGANNLDGVVLSYIQQDGAAEKNGFEKGDVILKIDQYPVKSKSMFDEQLSYYTPGDEIEVVFKRKNKLSNQRMVLTNREGTTSLIRREIFKSKSLGVDFESISLAEKDQLGVDAGIRVLNVRDGFFRRLGIKEGFIITSVNNKPVRSPQQLAEILDKITGRVRIGGINENGVRGYYSYYF